MRRGKPRGANWTEDLEAQLRNLRHLGLTWEAIAKEMNLTLSTVIEHARRIKLSKTRVVIEQKPIEVVHKSGHNIERQPYCAGHPITWAEINAGLVIENEPYPHKVFL